MSKVQRVKITREVEEIINQLREKNGPMMFDQSGGLPACGQQS